MARPGLLLGLAIASLNGSGFAGPNIFAIQGAHGLLSAAPSLAFLEPPWNPLGAEISARARPRGPKLYRMSSLGAHTLKQQISLPVACFLVFVQTASQLFKLPT